MSDGEEERRIKARHDGQFGGRRSRKMTAGRRQSLARADMYVEGSSSDDDEEEEYVPSPPRPTRQEKGKGLAGATSSRTVDDDIQMEEEDEEEFEAEEVAAQGGMHFGALMMHAPMNPNWRAKVSYKGKTELVRELRAKDPRPLQREAPDYRFHTFFQQDFYESVILAKTHPVALSQWIDWRYMESKNDPIFNEVISACEQKNLKAIMGFKKDWNNEVIAQFFASCFWEETEGTRKVHWMTEGRWFEISYAQFARLFGFGRNDENRIKLHYAPALPVHRMKFMYPRREQGNAGTTNGLLPFYVYLNRMVRKTVAPKEGDATNIASYTKNLLAQLDPTAPPFSVFEFIWEEIKSISMSPLKSCGYAPYIMHMIERVTGGTFECEVAHNPLKMKPTLRNPPPDEIGSGSAPAVSPPRATRRRGQQQDKPSSPIRKLFNMVFGLCKSQHATQVRQHNERQERKKLTKWVKEIHTKVEATPACSPIRTPSPESPIESFEDQMARYQQEDPFAVYYRAEAMAAAMGMGGAGGSTSAAPPPFAPPQPQDEEGQGEEGGEEGGEDDDDDDEATE